MDAQQFNMKTGKKAVTQFKDCQTVGARIRFLREKAGLFQSGLAMECNVSTSTVSLWETDKREPELEYFLKMAPLLHASASDIAFGTQGNTSEHYIDCTGLNLYKKHLVQQLVDELAK